MANTVHKTSIILSAVDRMSRVVDRAFNKADQRLVSFQKKADRIADSSAKLARTTGIIGAAAAAPIVFATKKAIDFEEAMADVSKVLNLQQGSAELNRMGSEAQKLGVHLAKTPVQAANMIAALAQGGTAREELFKIGKFTGEMSVAFDIMADTAGDAFTKTKNALGGTTPEIIKVMDAINFLSDNAAAKAPQILTFMASGGAGAAKMLNITGQEIASLGTFFIAMGKSGSEAATIVQRFTKGLQKNSAAAKLFRSSGGGMEGIIKVMEAGNKLGGQDRFQFFNAFGQYGADIALAASNLDKLRETTGLVADSSKFAGSVAGEFANRSKTRAFEIARLQSQLQSVAIKLGNVMLPVISELATALTPILDKLAKWIEKNPELTAQIVKGVAMFAAANFAVSGLSASVSGVARTFGVLSRGFQFITKGGSFLSKIMKFAGGIFKWLTPVVRVFTTVLGFLTPVIRSIGLALTANPIGVIIMAIAGAAFLVWKYWEPIKQFFINVWKGVKITFNAAWQFISGLHNRLVSAGRNIINSIWTGIKAMVNKPVETIKKMVQKIRNLLPFSPAKTGPLRDIHRIKLVETIAQTIKPAPAIAAMKRTVSAMVNLTPVGAAGLSLAGVGSGSGGGVNINFQPTINLVGGEGSGDLKEQIVTALNQYKGELLRMIEEAQANKQRVKF